MALRATIMALILCGIMLQSYAANPSSPTGQVKVSTKGSSSVEGLELTQKHEYFDDCVLTISPIGIRLHNKSRMGFDLVSTPPAWNTVVYRNDDKAYRSISFTDFMRTSIWSEAVSKTHDKMWLPFRPKQIKFKGLPAKQIAMGNRFLEYLPMPPEMSPATDDILHKLYKVPNNKGIPLTFWKIKEGKEYGSNIDITGHKQVLLTTSSIRRVTVSPDFFKAPCGYKESRSMQEVLMNNEARKSAGDMDELFEIGSDKGQATNHK